MGISTFFFILTPFGFFCTENGTGLITGTIFLTIGIICKLFENGTFDSVRKPKVSSEEFWKIHFRDRYYSFKNTHMHITAEDARRWANYICECHGTSIPSDTRFEEIAKEMGIETSKEMEKRKKEERIVDREAYRKYYMLTKIIKEFKLNADKEKTLKKKQKILDCIQELYNIRNEFSYCSGISVKSLVGLSGKKYYDSPEYSPVHGNWRQSTDEEKEITIQWANQVKEDFLKKIEYDE